MNCVGAVKRDALKFLKFTGIIGMSMILYFSLLIVNGDVRAEIALRLPTPLHKNLAGKVPICS